MAGITSASIFPLFRDGISAVIGNYPTYPDDWKSVFKTEKSDKGYELEDEFKSLGMAQKKLESQAIAQDNMAIRYQKTYTHDTYGTSFSISHESYQDNRYPKLFPQQLVALTNAVRAAKSQVAANVYNLGSVTNTSDGVPLFSALHPIDDGSNCTNYIATALSETAIQNGVIAIQQFKQLSGILTMVKPEKLLVGIGNDFAANVLLGSKYKASIGSGIAPTAIGAAQGANDISAIYNMGSIPKGVVVDRYITSLTFAAILTDAERGFIHYEREKLEDWSWLDQNTRDRWFAAAERFSFGVTNWRAVCALSL